MTSQAKAFLYAALTILAWSTVSTAFKVALETLSPMQLIYVSMATAALFLLGVMAVGKRLSEFRALTPGNWKSGVLLGFMLYLYYTVLFVAYDYLPAQIAQPINNTWALMLALLASWLMKQKLSARELFWMVFAYSGVLVISLGAGGELGPLHPLGMACIIISTLLYALYWIVNTKSRIPALPGLVICFAVSFLLAALTLLIRGEALLLPLRPLLGGVYVGLFELAIPFLLWGMALRLTSSVARISTLPFLVPFLALFWISIVIHEPIAWTTLLGLSIIISGTFMQQRIAARRSAATK
ncbi:DMT family transporter [Mailhella massiliensis]|uniref:DMT family transporter n=1 Tax=Mailhella massiliensis TaxID=1903261 RepID=A0A921DRW5_9BACT|nr:DMT family transporter [Mailhella massiliensis]HJD98135.1 DMT family transporter [Mailhella massiliensis]